MRLLLLGCTGFIGSELVPRLIHSGHQITLVSRKKISQVNFEDNFSNVTFLEANPSSYTSWQKGNLINALRNSDGVINLAGEPIAEKRWTQKHCEEIENSRLNTTKYLLEAITKHKADIKVIVNGSAIGFYGTSADAVFNENSLPGEDFLARLCNQWENIARTKNKKTRLVIIRIGIVLEKDGGALGKILPVFRAGFGGPIGNGMQWMSWIHRTDLCQIIDNAVINKHWSGTFNGVSPNPVQMIDFSKILGRTLHRPSLLPVPGVLLKILLGEGAKIVLEGQKVSCSHLNEIGFKFLYPDLKNALETIVKSSSK